MKDNNRKYRVKTIGNLHYLEVLNKETKGFFFWKEDVKTWVKCDLFGRPCVNLYMGKYWVNTFSMPCEPFIDIHKAFDKIEEFKNINNEYQYIYSRPLTTTHLFDRSLHNK